MWILTCEGDLLDGKRKWLRPGSAHLFGRTSGKEVNGQQNHFIDNKAVSRKHVIITIGYVKAGDSARLHARSQVLFEDSSKTGTTINGVKIGKEQKSWDATEYKIQLASYPQIFHLKWQPVILSFVNLPKKTKSREEMLAKQRQKLEQADIKIIEDYVANQTTHVCAVKRNNPHVLQALLQGKWIVTHDYPDALAAAVERGGTDAAGDVIVSPLEVDFDGAWPKEEPYLLGPGPEPVPRDTEYIKPRADRADLFSGYTFVFLSQAQHDNLMPVIMTGGGKPLLWDVQPGDTRSEEVIEYVKEIAGAKGDSNFRLTQQTGDGGVIVVKTAAPDGGRDEWTRHFLRDIENNTGQEMIEQNEFLDAVIMADVGGLKRPIEVPEGAPVSPPHSPAQRQPAAAAQEHHEAAEEAPPRTQDQAAETTEQAAPTTTRKRQRRVITQSRFKGFDDFDPSQFTRRSSDSPEPSYNYRDPSQAPSVQSMDVDDGPSQAAQTQRSSRKRPAPVEEENEEEQMEALFPGQARMKRMKTAAAKAGGSQSLTESLKAAKAAEEKAAAEKARLRKKKEKQMDVMAEIAARREKEEEERKANEEVLRQQFEGVDISELRNLAKVEEMEIKPRERPARDAGEGGHTDRWDPAWNGRKNFKKFRKQGSAQDGPRLRKVIVTLEEVLRRGQGVGDEYWLNSSTASSRGKSKSQSQSQSVRQAIHAGSDDAEDAVRFRRRLQTSRDEDADNPDNEQTLPEEIAGNARDANLAGLNGTPSQTMGTESQRKAAGKRPASAQSGGPAKKARQSRLGTTINLEDDDDEDALKFRRRRR